MIQRQKLLYCLAEAKTSGLMWYQTIVQFNDQALHPEKYASSDPLRFIVFFERPQRKGPLTEVMNLFFSTDLHQRTGMNIEDVLCLDYCAFDKLREMIRLDETRAREVEADTSRQMNKSLGILPGSNQRRNYPKQSRPTSPRMQSRKPSNE